MSLEAQATDDATYCVINFNPNLELISLVRRFVSDFYDHLLIDPDATSRVALATHELLENAMGYSTSGETTLRIEIRDHDARQDQLVIRIRNRTTQQHIGDIRLLFEEMGANSDPLAFYQTLLVRNAKRQNGSGLGLARIRAEGEMALSCEVDGDEVWVIAKTLVQKSAEQHACA